MNDRERYFATCGTPKPLPRRITKARKKRAHAMTVSEVREYVFARERNICRCCRKRPAESMHEIVFRSQRGKVSKKNSIAVCGDGVRGCHGFLQRHEIEVSETPMGAESTLWFLVVTPLAADWVGIHPLETIESPVMLDMELA